VAKKESIGDQRVLFLGAGSAGTGIADLIARSIELETGRSREEALKSVQLFDVNGLLCESRTDLLPFQKPFAAKAEPCDDFVQAIQNFRPTAIIGVSTVFGAFNESVIRAMAEINDRPIIFPYSNPTSRAECTAQQAYQWTDGRCLFASGTPMPPVDRQGKSIKPSQGNNVYIFPAMGMAILATGAHRVPQDAFLAAARSLATQVPADFFEDGMLYPSRSKIRAVSLHVAADVARCLQEMGLARHDSKDWDKQISEMAYSPAYS
ncbi:MAG: malic enzyme-like NAD(P)-binding protein, partial [Myxococcota bacterium]|nr:malic enzyme-like NAD(P)-binding protein [Myxococcota bacterium]